jgi:hypothetical protein
MQRHGPGDVLGARNRGGADPDDHVAAERHLNPVGVRDARAAPKTGPGGRRVRLSNAGGEKL